MPKLPIYERQVSKQPATLQNQDTRVNTPPEAFGTGIAEAASRLGVGTEQLGESLIYRKKQDDLSNVMDNLIKAKIEWQDGMYSEKTENVMNADGTVTPRRKGILTRTLKNAENCLIDYDKFNDELLNKYSEALPNKNQKAIFKQLFMKDVYVPNRDNVEIHERNQLNAYRDAQLDADVALNVNAMQKNPTLENIDTLIKTNNGKILQRYDGQSDEFLKAKILDTTDKTITPIIGSLLDNDNYTQAKLVIENQKNNMSAEVYSALNVKINEGQYIEIAKNISSSGLPLDKQLKKVDQIKEPMLARKVREEIKMRFNEKEAIKKENQRVYEEQEWDKLTVDPIGYKIPIAKLDADTQNQMLNFKRMAIDRANGKGGFVNWEKYSNFLTMPQSELKNTKISDILQIGDPPKITEIIKNRADAIKGIGGEKAERIISYQQQARNLISGMSEFGETRKTPTEKQNTKLNQFYEQFNKKISLIPEEERSVERVGQVGRELLRPVQTPFLKLPLLGAGIGKTIKAYELPYLEKDQAEKIALKALPENLKNNPNVKYSEATDQYYLDYENIREIYDVNGKLVAKLKRK